MKENQAFWGSKAAEWSNNQPFGEALPSIVDGIQDELRLISSVLTPKSYVLDLGAGANNSVYFKNLIPENQINCLDLSHQMLTYQISANRIQADLEYELPIKTASIDLCTSFFVARYLSIQQQKNLISEIYRILKPKGQILIVDVPRNKYEYQKAQFDPIILENYARSIGFDSVTGWVKTQKVTRYVRTGFGTDDLSFTYKCGYLSGMY